MRACVCCPILTVGMVSLFLSPLYRVMLICISVRTHTSCVLLPVLLLLLLLQVVGEYAEALESLTDAEIANAATSLLRDLFQRPGPDFIEVPDPIGCGHSAWKSETYSRGSWTLYPHVPQVVTVPDALERLSEVSSIGSEPDLSEEDLPVHLDRCDRLYYAGEATAVDHRGTVHGAFKSGILQANKLIERMRAV